MNNSTEAMMHITYDKFDLQGTPVVPITGTNRYYDKIKPASPGIISNMEPSKVIHNPSIETLIRMAKVS